MKQDIITSTLEQMRFAGLYLSDLNPRTDSDTDGIEKLAENINAHGLIQNLAGLRDSAGKVGIVAGGRRLRALALLQDDARFQTVSVNVAPDKETAQFWASSENSQREALHPADEIRNYGDMAERGVGVPAIAMAYGVTEKHVYRRLALAGLPAPILDGLKADQITLGQAAVFTIGTDAALSLEVFEDVLSRSEDRWGQLSEHQIKQRLKPASIRSTDRRATFVGQEVYKSAGGRLSGDLFDDVVLFDDPDILQEVFEAKLKGDAKALATEQGWAWVETCTAEHAPWDYLEKGKFARVYKVEGVLNETQVARYDALSELVENDALDKDEQDELSALDMILEGDYSQTQRTHAGIVMRVGQGGVLSVTAGLVRQADQSAAIEAGILQPSAHKTQKTKPAISDKLRSDLNRVETGARQNALLDDTKLALHLLAFQLCGQMGHSKAFGIRLDDVPNVPETETGYGLDTRLTMRETNDSDPWNHDLVKAFKGFRKRGDKQIMAVLHRYLVSQLHVGDSEFGSLIDKIVKRDTRSVWTPTSENFFTRVGGPYLNNLWMDLLERQDDHPTITTFNKLKKVEKAQKLEELFADPSLRRALGVTEAQEQRIATWLPEEMA